MKLVTMRADGHHSYKTPGLLVPPAVQDRRHVYWLIAEGDFKVLDERLANNGGGVLDCRKHCVVVRIELFFFVRKVIGGRIVALLVGCPPPRRPLDPEGAQDSRYCVRSLAADDSDDGCRELVKDLTAISETH